MNGIDGLSQIFVLSKKDTWFSNFREQMPEVNKILEQLYLVKFEFNSCVIVIFDNSILVKSTFTTGNSEKGSMLAGKNSLSLRFTFFYAVTPA